MDEIKVNHGIIRPLTGLKTKDVDALRDKICVGDILRCPRMVKDSNGDLTEKWEKVAVTEKYPNLVTVESARGRSIPSERLHTLIF